MPRKSSDEFLAAALVEACKRESATYKARAATKGSEDWYDANYAWHLAARDVMDASRALQHRGQAHITAIILAIP